MDEYGCIWPIDKMSYFRIPLKKTVIVHSHVKNQMVSGKLLQSHGEPHCLWVYCKSSITGPLSTHTHIYTHILHCGSVVFPPGFLYITLLAHFPSKSWSQIWDMIFQIKLADSAGTWLAILWLCQLHWKLYRYHKPKSVLPTLKQENFYDLEQIEWDPKQFMTCRHGFTIKALALYLLGLPTVSDVAGSGWSGLKRMKWAWKMVGPDHHKLASSHQDSGAQWLDMWT